MKVLEKNKQITFADERFYQTGEDFYPSVTTYLDAYYKGHGLKEWLKREGSNADKILKEAGEQGTRVHEAIEELVRGGKIGWDGQNYSMKEWIMINKFIEFYQFITDIKEIELTLVDPKLECGGTLDMICTINKETWLIDHKTSNSIWKTHHIQTSVYKAMYENLTGNKIDKVGILWLNSAHRGPRKDSIQGKGWILIEVTDTERLLTLFASARLMWQEENPNARPKNLVYPTILEL